MVRKSQPVPVPESERELGGITLSESGGVRYLHFGTPWIQGAMRISRPYRLELEYQQQMMAPWLLMPEPRGILQLGLGAAALTKFCHRYLPSARVVVVELDPDVIATARRWFALPEPDSRLQVLCEDARQFLLQSHRGRSADWLQVDLYDAAARGPVFDDLSFYRACRACLREPGLACFNLFGRHCRPSLDTIAEAFEGRLAVLPESRAGNRVALAAAGEPIRVDAEALQARARSMEAEPGLPAGRWLKGLRRYSRGGASRFDVQEGLWL